MIYFIVFCFVFCGVLHVAVTLLVAPQTEGCFEGSVAEFAHILPLECQGRERGCMVEQGV